MKIKNGIKKTNLTIRNLNLHTCQKTNTRLIGSSDWVKYFHWDYNPKDYNPKDYNPKDYNPKITIPKNILFFPQNDDVWSANHFK